MKATKPEWKQATDPTGRIYYYNRYTRETTWTNPYPTSSTGMPTNMSGTERSTNDGPTVATITTITPSSTQTNKKMKNHPMVSTKPLYKEAIDPVTQRKYWYNRITKESYWERPIDLSTLTATTEPSFDTKDTVPTVPQDHTILPVSTIPRPLSTVSGGSNITTVERKMEDDESNDTRLSRNETNAPGPSEIRNVTEQQQQKEKNSLPSGWKQVYDAQSQKYYYYHRATRTVQWDKPTTLRSNDDSKKNTDDPSMNRTTFGSVASTEPNTGSNNRTMNQDNVTITAIEEAKVEHAISTETETKQNDTSSSSSFQFSTTVTSAAVPVTESKQNDDNAYTNSITPSVTTNANPSIEHSTTKKDTKEDNSVPTFDLEATLDSVRNTRAFFQSLSNTKDTGISTTMISPNLSPPLPPSSLPLLASSTKDIVSPATVESSIPSSSAATLHTNTRPDFTITVKSIGSESSSSSELLSKESTVTEKKSISLLPLSDMNERRPVSSSTPSLSHSTEFPNDEPVTPRSPSATRTVSSKSLSREPLIIPKLSKAFMERKKPDLPLVLLEQIAERTYQKHQEHILSKKLSSTLSSSSSSSSSTASQPYTPTEPSIQGLLPLSLPGTALSPEAYSLQIGGYLWKKSRKGWKQWLRRFFLTQRWHLLYYEYDNTPADTPLGIFDLRYLTDVRLGKEIIDSRNSSNRSNSGNPTNPPTEPVSAQGKSLKWLPMFGNSVKQSIENDGFDILCYLELRIRKASVFSFGSNTVASSSTSSPTGTASSTAISSQTVMLLRAATPYIASEWYEAIVDIISRYGCEVTPSSIVYPKILRKNPVASHPDGSFSLLENVSLPSNASSNVTRSSPTKVPIIPVATHPEGNHSIQTLSLLPNSPKHTTSATDNHNVQRSPLRYYPSSSSLSSTLSSSSSSSVAMENVPNMNFDKPITNVDNGTLPNHKITDTSLPSIIEEEITTTDDIPEEVPVTPSTTLVANQEQQNGTLPQETVTNADQERVVSATMEPSVVPTEEPTRTTVPITAEIVTANVNESVTPTVITGVPAPNSRTTDIDNKHTLDDYTQYLAETRQRMMEMNNLLARLNGTTGNGDSAPTGPFDSTVTATNSIVSTTNTVKDNETIVPSSSSPNPSRLHSPSSTLQRMQSRIRSSPIANGSASINNHPGSESVSRTTTNAVSSIVHRSVSTVPPLSLRTNDTFDKLKDTLQLFILLLASRSNTAPPTNHHSSFVTMVTEIISSEQLIQQRRNLTQLSISLVQQYSEKLSSSPYVSHFQDTLVTEGLDTVFSTLFSHLVMNPSILLLGATQLRSVQRMHNYVEFLAHTLYHPLYSSPLAVLHLLSLTLENLSLSPGFNLQLLNTTNDGSSTAMNNVDPRILFTEELCTLMHSIGYFTDPSSLSSSSPFQCIINHNWDIHVESKLSEDDEPDADEIFILLLLSCFTSSASLVTLPLELPLTMYLVHTWKGREAAIEYILVHSLFSGIEKHLLKRQQVSLSSGYTEEFDDDMIRHTMEALANSAGNSHNNPLIDMAINTVFELWLYIGEYCFYHEPLLPHSLRLSNRSRGESSRLSSTEPKFPTAIFSQQILDLDDDIFRSILDNRLSTIRSNYLRPLASLSSIVLTTKGFETFIQALKRLYSSSSSINLTDSLPPFVYSSIVTLMDKLSLLDPYLMNTTETFSIPLSLSMDTVVGNNGNDHYYRLAKLPYLTYTTDIATVDKVKYTIPRLLHSFEEINVSIPSFFSKLLSQIIRNKTVPLSKWKPTYDQEIETIYTNVRDSLLQNPPLPVMEEEIVQLLTQLSEGKPSIQSYIDENDSQVSRQKYFQSLWDTWNPPPPPPVETTEKVNKSSLSFFWNNQNRSKEDSTKSNASVPLTVLPKEVTKPTIGETVAKSLTKTHPTNPLMKSLTSSLFSSNLWSSGISATANSTATKESNGLNENTSGSIVTVPKSSSSSSSTFSSSFWDSIKQSQGIGTSTVVNNDPSLTVKGSTMYTVDPPLPSSLKSDALTTDTVVPVSSPHFSDSKPRAVQIFGDLPNSSNLFNSNNPNLSHDYSLSSSLSSISSPLLTFSPSSSAPYPSKATVVNYASPVSIATTVSVPNVPVSQTLSPAATTKLRSPFTLYEHGRSDVIQLSSPLSSSSSSLSVTVVPSSSTVPVTSSKPYLHSSNRGIMQSLQTMMSTNNNVPSLNDTSVSLTSVPTSTATIAPVTQRIPPHLRTPARPTTLTAIPRSTFLSSTKP